MDGGNIDIVQAILPIPAASKDLPSQSLSFRFAFDFNLKNLASLLVACPFEFIDELRGWEEGLEIYEIVKVSADVDSWFPGVCESDA